MPSGLASDAQDFGGPVVSRRLHRDFDRAQGGPARFAAIALLRRSGRPGDRHAAGIARIRPAFENSLDRTCRVPRLAARSRSGGKQGNVRTRADCRRIARQIRRGDSFRALRFALRSGARYRGHAAGCVAHRRRGIAGNDDGSARLHRSRDREPSQPRLRQTRGNFTGQIRSRHRPGPFHAARNAATHTAGGWADGASCHSGRGRFECLRRRGGHVERSPRSCPGADSASRAKWLACLAIQ